MRILAALDSFKGCMSSREAGEAVAKACEVEDVRVLSVADGGEGTLSAIQEVTDGKTRAQVVNDALMHPKRVEWLLSEGCAFLELARSAGLADLSADERDVMHTTTYGFGENIKAAIEAGAKDIVMTLGGSATNDCGLGALQALGLVIYGHAGKINRPIAASDMSQITGIDAAPLSAIKRDVRFRILYDADIPLLGRQGAVGLYARQKGAAEKDLPLLEAGMKKMAALIEHISGCCWQDVAGAGAAGGAGYGLAALLGAETQPGIDYVLDRWNFDELLRDTDLVITGEGKADAQTAQGKTAMGILRRCLKAGVPCRLFAGRIEDLQALLSAGFSQAVDINAGYPEDDSAMVPEIAADRLMQAVRNSLAI